MLGQPISTEKTALAPAKVNLFLEILAKRPDGFHELETVMTAISLYDTLHFQPRANGHLSLSCHWAWGIQAKENSRKKMAARTNSYATASTGQEDQTPFGDLPTGEDNIVLRALRKLQVTSQTTQGAHITLIKRIPSAAGLGGASSDAAAVLLAANASWQLGFSDSRLAAIGAEIGSDVPYFLQRGAAICRGRGEQIEPIAAQPWHLVVVRPPIGLSTPKVYAQCKPAEAAQSVNPLQATLTSGNRLELPAALLNRLEPPAAALTPWIERLRQTFGQLGCVAHQMSGSGSSYFGIFRHQRQARRMAACLSGMQVGAVLQATTLS